MKYLHFFKNGIYLDFTIDDKGILYVNSISSEKKKNMLQHHLMAPVEIEACGINNIDFHGTKHIGGGLSSTLKYISHTETEKELVFVLKNETIEVKAHYEFFCGIKVVRTYCEISNISNQDIILEHVSSFRMYGFSIDKVMIPHSSWRRDIQWRQYSPEDLGFFKTDSIGATKKIAANNTGSWSCKEYLPMGCLRSGNETILWQIEALGSWCWEISDIDCPKQDLYYIDLSGPSENENHFWKNIGSGESFKSLKAAVCIVCGDFGDALSEMNQYRRITAYRSPADKNLPIIFNDWGANAGNQTTAKELALIDEAKELGCEYFIMDAGWYDETSDGQSDWWNIGDWNIAQWRFPNGLNEVFDKVRECGMIPGIWIEPECIAVKNKAVSLFDDECFFMRHGKRVAENGRHFLDLRNSKVKKRLDKIIDRFVNTYGVGYFKFDYNTDAGIGTEIHADSPGDGLMQYYDAYENWIREICKRHPDLIIENCASGGLRMDFMGLFSISALTDAGTLREVCCIGAAASTVIPPEASLSFLGVNENTKISDITYFFANSMMRRIGISGTPSTLDKNVKTELKNAVAIYKKLRKNINLLKPYYPLGVPNLNSDWICSAYFSENGSYVSFARNSGSKNAVAKLRHSIKSAKVIYPENASGLLEYDGDEISVSLEIGEAVLIFAEMRTEHE